MIIMWIFLLICGIGFIAFGIRHNQKIHAEEGTGGGGSSGSIIVDYVMEHFYALLDRLPYWVAKSLYFTVAILCFYLSYLEYDA